MSLSYVYLQNIVITPDMTETTPPETTPPPTNTGSVIIVPVETTTSEESDYTTSSGEIGSYDFKEMITILETQNHILIASLAFLGAILGAIVFRHLRK